MAITRDEVLHVARLARLALTDEEVERLGAQLNAILEAVGKVAELDLSDVGPTSNSRRHWVRTMCSPTRPTAKTTFSGCRRRDRHAAIDGRGGHGFGRAR